MVEAHQLDRACNLAGEQRVTKTEQGIDWIGGGTFDTSWKRPLPGIREQPAKAAKVGRAACPFQSQNRFQGSPRNAIISACQSLSSVGLLQGQGCQLVQQLGYLLNRLSHLSVGLTALVALQHRALIGQLANDEAP